MIKRLRFLLFRFFSKNASVYDSSISYACFHELQLHSMTDYLVNFGVACDVSDLSGYGIERDDQAMTEGINL